MSRRQLFEAIEQPVMRALPTDDFEYAEWHLARVGIDYHVEVQGFFYSVPHALIREQVDTRATQRTVEVFHRGKRVAAHARRYDGPRHGTQPEHMPSAHRRGACPRAGLHPTRGPSGRRSACNATRAASGPRQRR